MILPAPPLNLYIVKVASRCNLNCSYCYVYNKGDRSWRQQPATMSDTTFRAVLERIRSHCVLSGQDVITLSFHGGEPCLIGTQQFDTWCGLADELLGGVAKVQFALQTNGTLLNKDWVKLLLKYRVQVGVSLDGPKSANDSYRVDHKNRGTYDTVVNKISLVREAGISFGIISVIHFDADPITTHRHLLTLGCHSINYLLPDFNHDTIKHVRHKYGLTPCADFLIPIFDDWWEHGTINVRINIFWDIARIILGGESQSDYFGNGPLNFVVVNTDGNIEGHDVLRICGEDFSKLGLNVNTNDFKEIMKVGGPQASAISNGVALPEGCRPCPERSTCGGGHLPHRYSRERDFDNPSVWCADLLALFSHIRKRLEVSPEETERRRTTRQARLADASTTFTST